MTRKIWCGLALATAGAIWFFEKMEELVLADPPDRRPHLWSNADIDHLTAPERDSRGI